MTMHPPFAYRSLSFHESWPREELVGLGAQMGFNDCTFQTEKGTMPRLYDLRRRADEQGLFALARRHDMGISVWTHELGEPEEDWLPATVDNPRLWRGLRARYDHILGELLPELDTLVLTVVESRIELADARLLPRLVETLLDRCRHHGKRLALRTFVHHPEQHAEMAAALAALPDEVVLLTKCVPQDWHLRQGHDPLLGAVGNHRQWVECDIAGEYWQEDRLAHAIGHILEPQFRHWQACGCEGISVRVDRGWKPWDHQATVLGQAQEADLWLLGLLGSGAETTADACWQRYTDTTFGPAAAAMTSALRPSGRVIEEACHVDRESFGLLRLPVSVRETFEGVPGWKRHLVLDGRLPRPTARAYADADDAMYRNPFHGYASVQRWDPAYRPTYQRLRRGDPALIDAKQAAVAEALTLATDSLAALAAARPDLPALCEHHHRWQLEENRHYLRVMSNMQLAWLNAERCLYCEQPSERRERRQAVESHLAELEAWLAAHADDRWRGTWDHRHQERRRLSGIDVQGFLAGFRAYFACLSQPRRPRRAPRLRAEG